MRFASPDTRQLDKASVYRWLLSNLGRFTGGDFDSDLVEYVYNVLQPEYEYTADDVVTEVKEFIGKQAKGERRNSADRTEYRCSKYVFPSSNACCLRAGLCTEYHRTENIVQLIGEQVNVELCVCECCYLYVVGYVRPRAHCAEFW